MLNRKRGHRIRTLVHAHSRFLTFLSALVVFTTFIIKDAVREHLKNLVDASEAAQNRYEVQAADNGFAVEFRDIRARLVDLVRISQGTRVDTKKSEREEWQMLDHMNESFATDLDTLSDLVEKLPDQDGTLRRLEELRKGLKETKDNWMWGRTPPRPPGGPPYISREPEDVRDDVYALRSKSDSLTREVLIQAKRTRDKDEHYYKILTWFSYPLYGASSILGLFASLYGGKEPAAVG